MCAALGVASLASPAAPVSAEEAAPLRVLGEIKGPDGAARQRIMALDPVRRRMYVRVARAAPSGYSLATYDLGVAVPRLLSERPLPPGAGFGTISASSSFLEPTRRRLYMLGGDEHALMTSQLIVLGAEGNQMEPVVWSMAERLPGFFASGMSYSATDDRIYLIGEMSGSGYVTQSTYTFGTKVVGGTATIVALDPDDGALLWTFAIPECRFPLYTPGVGTLIARSGPTLSPPRLLVPCTPGGSPTGNTNVPHQGGVAVVTISGDAGAAEAARFDVRFHPVSGSFWNGAQSGVAGFDRVTNRLYLQSISQMTPGAWVFDAPSSSWIGAITAPAPNATQFGINERLGHYYMGGVVGGSPQPQDFLLISNSRSRRPQNGVRMGSEIAPSSDIHVDPPTNRLFYARSAVRPELLVVEDLMPPFPPESPVNFDALTDDIAESPSTFVSFTGDSGGFGARVTAVGDTASIRGTAGQSVPVGQASRSVTIGRIPSVNLQAAGAAAAAQQAAVDTTTDAELRQSDPAPEWQYGITTCLDGGDGVETAPQENGSGVAAVTCDLERYAATGHAHHSGISEAGVSVGRATATSETRRTVAEGLVTRAESASSGIHVELGPSGSLHIGKVTAVAEVRAHGRSGTAAAAWWRGVEDVVAKDATGRVVFQSRGCTSAVSNDGKTQTVRASSEACDAIAEGVRRALQVNVRVHFPIPDVTATPRGAYGSVGQSEADYGRETAVNDQGRLYERDALTRRVAPAVQIDVYHDSQERSRNIFQLAGVEAAAVFTVNRNLDGPACAGGGCIAGGSETRSGGLGSPSTPATGPGTSIVGTAAGASGEALGGPPGTGRMSKHARQRVLAVGFLFARRGLRDGALMALLLMFLAAAPIAVVRRQGLARLVEAP